MKSRKETRKLFKRMNSTVEELKQRYGVSKTGEIIGINYLLATVKVMDEMNPGEIFTDNDYVEIKEYEDNDYGIKENEKNGIVEFDNEREYNDIECVGSIGLSKKFSIKRIRRFNSLLKDFSNFEKYLSCEETISRRKEELEGRLLEFGLNGKVDSLNKNGLYSSYIAVIQGYLTNIEMGNKVLGIIEAEYKKLISSEQT